MRYNAQVEFSSFFSPLISMCYYRYGHISYIIGDRVFIAGGMLPSQKRSVSLTCLNLELSSILWTKELDTGSLVLSACEVLNEVCYIFGGKFSEIARVSYFFKELSFMPVLLCIFCVSISN